MIPNGRCNRCRREPLLHRRVLLLRMRRSNKQISSGTDRKTGSRTHPDFQRNLRPTQLSRYCLENYFSLATLRATFGEIIPPHLTKLEHSVAPWHQNVDSSHPAKWRNGQLKSARNVPRILNDMTLIDIENADLLAFCEKVESVV